MRTEEAMERDIPQLIELEGGGSNWWYVCPECRGNVDRDDRFCRHCGQAITSESRKEKGK